jgi:hypothetical protein
MKAASREFIKPFILIPLTIRSASIMVQAFTTKLKILKVIILMGKVNNSSSGLTSKLTINKTNPMSSNDGISRIIIVLITMDSRYMVATDDRYFNRSLDIVSSSWII